MDEPNSKSNNRRQTDGERMRLRICRHVIDNRHNDCKLIFGIIIVSSNTLGTVIILHDVDDDEGVVGSYCDDDCHDNGLRSLPPVGEAMRIRIPAAMANTQTEHAIHTYIHDRLIMIITDN